MAETVEEASPSIGDIPRGKYAESKDVETQGWKVYIDKGENRHGDPVFSCEGRMPLC